MYLIVNCLTKEVWQQEEFGIDDPLRDDPNILCFSSRMVPWKKGQPPELLFEVACDSLTGWDEIPVDFSKSKKTLNENN